MSEAIELSNYDIHRQLYSSVEPLTEDVLATQLASVGAWFSSNMQCSHYTLMCRELYDFTVLQFKTLNFDKATQELRELLESRGEIMDIAYSHSTKGYECWVRNSDGEINMYLLFESPWIVIDI